MSETPLTRRHFVASTLALGGLAVLGPVACGPVWDRRRAAADLTRIAGHADAWATVGLEYLTAYPDEKGVGSITEALVADLGWQPWLPVAPLAEAAPAPGGESTAAPIRLERRLHDRIVHELRTEQTVQVQGWILSRTEARIAALVTLVGPESLAAATAGTSESPASRAAPTDVPREE